MRIAIMSVHGCPLLPPGSREAGGMNVYISMLGHEMARGGIELDVFTRRHDPDDPEVIELAPNLRVIHVDAGEPSRLSKDDLYPTLSEFVEGVDAFQQRAGVPYDLIHAHYWLSGYVGVALKRRWNVPLVAMFHTLGAVKNQSRVGEHESDLRIQAERAMIPHIDAIITATKHERDLIARLYDCPPQKVHVIPCGVDLDLFRPADRLEARQAIGIDDERVLLFVGRADPLKGLEVLINAVSQLEQPAGVRVLVVGGESRDAPEFRPAQDLANALQIGDRISYLGSVSHQQLPNYYNAADVCVIPSYYESFGLVALEAMACGTPVVAARVGGLQSTVRDGETGFLIPWHCPEPYAERLDLLLNNETLRSSLGENARNTAESYRWSNVAQQIVTLYEDVLARSHAASNGGGKTFN